MVKRVIIGSEGGSPLRVSVAGVDASSAQFNNLIFDGNQPPLRLYSTGYVTARVLQASGSDRNTAAIFTNGPPVPVTPSGTTPIFFCMVRQPTSSGVVNPGGVGNANSPPFRTYNFYGLGGSIVDDGGNIFLGFNCNRDTTGTMFSADGVINFAILKNYQ
jgi:hypothetical protein